MHMFHYSRLALMTLPNLGNETSPRKQPSIRTVIQARIMCHFYWELENSSVAFSHSTTKFFLFLQFGIHLVEV